MRSVLYKCLKTLRLGRQIYNLQVRRFEISITGDRVTKLNESTLTGRLLIYLNNVNNHKDVKNDCNGEILDILNCGNGRKLQECDFKELLSGLGLLANRHYFNDKLKFLTSLDILDSEYCRRINLLSNDEIFEILHVFMSVIPNRIVESKFYHIAVQKLFSASEKLPQSDLVQLIFFIGLQKKRVSSSEMLRKCINNLNATFIDNLTTEELCIICNSTFKTSTKITNQVFLDKLVNYLNVNLFLLKDPALFITLIKSIRHNRCQTEDLLATISCTVFFNKTLECYSFAAVCHILALYSDFLYYDENLIKALTDHCLKILKASTVTSKNDYFLDNPRIKDINRLLWSLSNLNYKHLNTSDLKEVIVPSVIERFEGGECKEDCSILIDIFLSLWMLNYRAYELVPYVVTKESITILQGLPLQNQHRLNLLISCIYFEDRKLFKELSIHPQCINYNTNFQLEKRPVLKKIIDNLKKIGAQHEINKFEVGCQIPGLNIIGITGYRKRIYKAVHIEILDEYTSLKNVEDMPTGLMQLKLRILNGLDEGVIVINSEEMDSVTDEEIQDIVLDEIDLVC